MVSWREHFHFVFSQTCSLIPVEFSRSREMWDYWSRKNSSCAPVAHNSAGRRRATLELLLAPPNGWLVLFCCCLVYNCVDLNMRERDDQSGERQRQDKTKTCFFFLRYLIFCDLTVKIERVVIKTVKIYNSTQSLAIWKKF